MALFGGLETEGIYQPDENISTVQLFNILTIALADLDNLGEHQPSFLPKCIVQSRDGNFLLYKAVALEGKHGM